MESNYLLSDTENRVLNAADKNLPKLLIEVVQ